MQWRDVFLSILSDAGGFIGQSGKIFTVQCVHKGQDREFQIRQDSRDASRDIFSQVLEYLHSYWGQLRNFSIWIRIGRSNCYWGHFWKTTFVYFWGRILLLSLVWWLHRDMSGIPMFVGSELIRAASRGLF